ncbi:MAG: peptidylprolyl isomerase [Acidobacteria bacterium]|nr:peptidylprolyl isomerase [Acidobacteriota bacterium]
MKFCVLLLCAIPLLAADAAVVEEIIAKVNGDIITRTELERTRKQLEAELRQRGLSDPELEKEMKERSNDILRERIDQLLLVQKGKELNINVDPEVSKYLADLQLQSKIAQPEKFQEFVKQQTGQPYEDYRAEIRNGFLTQRVIRQEVGGRVSVPRADLQKYYDEHKSEFMREDRVFLREILVSTEGKDAAGIAAAEKKARDLVARARKGERFHELARDNSDAVTARQGGELGGFKRGELNKAIEDVVFDKERGSVTDPIRVSAGFLILRVEEKHKAGQAGFEEVENEIMEKLFMPKFQPAVREYLTRLREEAYLEIKPDFVDTAPAPGKDTRWKEPAQLRPETVTKEEVAAQTRRRRLFWLLPIPGTQTTVREGSSKSR